MPVHTGGSVAVCLTAPFPNGIVRNRLYRPESGIYLELGRMVSCPQCQSPHLSTSSLKLGTPAFPVRCSACCTEYHGNYFWLGLLVVPLASVSALIAAMVLSTFWRSSAAILLPFAIAIALLLAASIPLARRQVPVRTSPLVKTLSRAAVALMAVYILLQVASDLVAA